LSYSFSILPLQSRILLIDFLFLQTLLFASLFILHSLLLITSIPSTLSSLTHFLFRFSLNLFFSILTQSFRTSNWGLESECVLRIKTPYRLYHIAVSDANFRSITSFY
jgi:hypothetical protein